MKKTAKIIVFILMIAIFLLPLMALASSPEEGSRREQKERRELREENRTKEKEEEQKIGDYVKERTKNIKEKDAAERAKIRAEVTLKIQERLKAVIEKAIKRYEKVKIQIQNSNLSEEEKNKVTVQLDEQIVKLNLLLVEVDGIENVNELRTTIKRVRADFKVSLGLVRQSIKGVLEDRLNEIVEKLERAHTRSSEVVAGLPEGAQKEELKILLKEAETQIEVAKNYINMGSFFEARESLGLARESLSEVALSINDLNL